MRHTSIVRQVTGTELLVDLGIGIGFARIARRWQRIMHDGLDYDRTTWRVEQRLNAALDWLPLGDDADWLSSQYSAYERLNQLVRTGRVVVSDDKAREILWLAHLYEWALGADDVHRDAIREDRMRGIVATIGVEGFLDLVAEGDLLKTLQTMQREEAA